MKSDDHIHLNTQVNVAQVAVYHTNVQKTEMLQICVKNRMKFERQVCYKVLVTEKKQCLEGGKRRLLSLRQENCGKLWI